MRKSRLLAALLAFLVTASFVAGYPKLVPYVNDFAGVLTPSQESRLNSMARQIEQSTTVQIAIVTVESTGGEDRVLYANHLGDESGIGQAATDNGLVLLWSRANEKGGAIAVGSGIESILNDAKVGRIGRESRPYFDRQDYYGGFLSMLDGISGELDAGEAASGAGAAQSARGTSMSSSDVLMWIMILGILILVVIALSRRQRREGYWRPGPIIITGRRRHWKSSSGFRAGSFVGRGFGGFGRGGFGGGGFSGGGAKF